MAFTSGWDNPPPLPPPTPRPPPDRPVRPPPPPPAGLDRDVATSGEERWPRAPRGTERPRACSPRGCCASAPPPQDVQSRESGTSGTGGISGEAMCQKRLFLWCKRQNVVKHPELLIKGLPPFLRIQEICQKMNVKHVAALHGSPGRSPCRELPPSPEPEPGRSGMKSSEKW